MMASIRGRPCRAVRTTDCGEPPTPTQARSRPVQNRWIGQRIDDPRVDLVAMARAQGFESEDPVSTTEALVKALQRGAEVVAKGGRYFIDSVITPGYADTEPDQRGGG